MRSGRGSATFDSEHTSAAKSQFFKFQGAQKLEKLESGSELKFEAEIDIFLIANCAFLRYLLHYVRHLFV